MWDAAPADRKHATELATEARDGYAAIPDLAFRLAQVDRWLSSHSLTRAPSRPSQASTTVTRPPSRPSEVTTVARPAEPEPPPPPEDPARL
jgi:hypothetical protein